MISISIIVWIILLLFCASIAGAIARSKNRDAIAWFLLGLLFGPFAWAVALLAPLDLVDPESAPSERSCYYCGQLCQDDVDICSGCGETIDGPHFREATWNLRAINWHKLPWRSLIYLLAALIIYFNDFFPTALQIGNVFKLTH